MIEFRKDIFADERDDNLNEIGQPTMRQDILGHVTGRSPFFDDHLFDGLTHLKCVRSPHHRARIRHIDTSAAERMPGVHRVLTERDVPVNRNTLLSLIDFGKDDEPALAAGMVNYVGEPVVAVVADTERQARDACAVVKVDYEVLPHVLDVEEALQPDAPVVSETYPNNVFDYHEKYDHQKLRFGDVDAAFAASDHIVEARYQMSPIEHAPTETNGAIAVPETNNRIACYTSTQALFFSLGTTAKLMDISSARLHFIGGTVGGGFGGKVDTVVEPLAVLACMLTGRPVRFVYDREDEMQVSSPRGAERWYLKDGVMNDGRIVAREFRGYFDGGAFTRLSSYAVIKGTAHLPGPYSIPNVSANVYGVYTNRTPASAMRGFGITGVDFAIECQMDRVAEKVNMDPVELRLLNAYRDGDMKPHRRLAKNCALIECMQVAAEKSGWNLGESFASLSSRVGGGGERAVIPDTVTDEDGKIGSSRTQQGPHGQTQVSSELGGYVPSSAVAPLSTPAGTSQKERASSATTPSSWQSTQRASQPLRPPSAATLPNANSARVPLSPRAPVSPPVARPPISQPPPAQTPSRSPTSTQTPAPTRAPNNPAHASSAPSQNSAANTASPTSRRNNQRFSSLFGSRRR